MAGSSHGGIVAVSQQSRFHSVKLESLSKDIDLKGVRLSVGDRELLSDAELKLLSGVRYGLIGRNGVGKTSLLKAIGFGNLVGLPQNIKALYVDQLESTNPEARVIDVVLGSNRELKAAEREAALLSKAIENGDPDTVLQAYRRVKLDQLIGEREEAQKVATKRSGQRGLEARAALIDSEAREEVARKELERCPADVSDEERARALMSAQEMLTSAFERLELMAAGAAEGKARKILRGLGFKLERQDRPLRLLSGGWKVRAALAQALYVEPDLMLLDEPTNHLDLPAILWLQNYLQSLGNTTVVIVSHDRAFLNATVDEIIELKKGALFYHVGNYDDFARNEAERRGHMERLKANDDRKRSVIQKTIQENIRHAARSGDDKKLNQVASRKKKLERLGLEANSKGHKFKLNRDRPGYHNTVRDEIVVDREEPPVTFKFPEPLELRHHGPVVALEGVGFGYERGGKQILKDVTLNIEMGERIALLGANGAGKTTLVKLVLGLLLPDAGTVTRPPQVKVGYYSQNHVEVLRAEHAAACALAYFKEAFPGEGEQELRAQLGAFGIKGALATQPIASLSGGQTVRVALAAAVHARPHFLVLDEPSNHLDAETVQALVESLREFAGAVLLVTHDQYVVEQVATKTFLVQRGGLHFLENGVEDYKKMLAKKVDALL